MAIDLIHMLRLEQLRKHRTPVEGQASVRILDVPGIAHVAQDTLVYDHNATLTSRFDESYQWSCLRRIEEGMVVTMKDGAVRWRGGEGEIGGEWH